MNSYHTKNIVIALGLAALVVGAGGVGYVLYTKNAAVLPIADTSSHPQIPVPVAPENSKTQIYKNETYGFALDLPSGWVAENLDAKIVGGEILFSSPESKVLFDHNHANCEDKDEQTVCIPEGVWGDIEFSNHIVPDMIPGTVKQVTLNNISFTQYDEMGLIGETHYRTKKDGKIYDFAIFKDDHAQEVMSSFRFVDTSSENQGTQDWKIYTNEKYSFTIKYPAHYSIFQGVDQKKETIIPSDTNSRKVIITEKPDLFFSSEPTYLSVEILDTYVTDFEKWIKNNRVITPQNEYRVVQGGATLFAGEQAYVIKVSCGIDSPGNIILVNHGSKTYYIRYDSEECLPFSEKIISTFKFTK